ncbi:MAG: ATP synthase F0 subunit B [Desulfobacterales bacterium]|nr:ATP synthase F0 subunit B [Desulfobacterales bacterium]
MIKIDASLFIQIINFLFLIWVLNLLLYKPIRNILIQRKDKIKNMETSIESSVKDASEKDRSFYEGIKNARMSGIKEKENIVKIATDEEKKIIAQINEKASANLNEIKSKILKEREEVKKVLELEVDSFAGAIVQKILGRVN